MCEMASFVFRPVEGVPVKTWDLMGHSETMEHFNLRDGSLRDGWREGHYKPDGALLCRVLDQDGMTGCECEAVLRERWPTFGDFLGAVLPLDYPGSLDLDGLTSAKDLKLPETVSGYLDLRGLTSAKDLKLPETVSGSLNLLGSYRSLNEARGLVADAAR